MIYFLFSNEFLEVFGKRCLKALRSSMVDIIYVDVSDALNSGPHRFINELLALSKRQSGFCCTIYVWPKNHPIKDSPDFINVWYKEIDTYKSGKVDSANYE